MTQPQVHILNGDHLKEQLASANLDGELIIMRECLMNGNVQGESLHEFYKCRASYLAATYPTVRKDYTDFCITEFNKIQSLPSGVEINLWFEDDLFCQVNLWFVCYLLAQSTALPPVYLVRPDSLQADGFYAYDNVQLLELFKDRTEVKEVKLLGQLWELYKQGELEELTGLATQLENKYPFIHEAVCAHIDRIPKNGEIGKPQASLLAIIQDLQTDDLSVVFPVFREAQKIYGYGDLQVQQMIDELNDNNLNN
jgi:hypothetical protein